MADTTSAERIRAFKLPDWIFQDEYLSRSAYILEYAHDSAESLLNAFDLLRERRGAARGATTDEEQDLLRAMVTMAAAGLDSMLKQVMRESLPPLLDADRSVRGMFEKHIERKVKLLADETRKDVAVLISRAFASPEPRQELIEDYLQALTGSSLQSAAELSKALAALGLTVGHLPHPLSDLKPIFSARNEIVHEMDMDFDQPRRNRRTRRMDDMIAATRILLETCESILTLTAKKIKSLDD